MTGPSGKRRSARRPNQFGAPWGRAVKLATGAGCLVMVVVAILPQLIPFEKPGAGWVRVLLPGVVVAVFGITALFCVRGFTLKGRELLIQRSLWETRLTLDSLKEAHADPGAMEGSLRIAGNGGFLAFTGWFRSRNLGSYRAFVTDPARSVVLTFRDRKIVVSPDDPDGFVKALGFKPEPETSRS